MTRRPAQSARTASSTLLKLTAPGGDGDGDIDRGREGRSGAPLVLTDAERETVEGDAGVHPGPVAGDGQVERQGERPRDPAQTELTGGQVFCAAQGLEAVGDEGGAWKFGGGEKFRHRQGLIAVGVSGRGRGRVNGYRHRRAGEVGRVEMNVGVPAREAA